MASTALDRGDRIAQTVLYKAEVAKVLRTLKARLELANYKAQHGFEKLDFETVESKIFSLEPSSSSLSSGSSSNLPVSSIKEPKYPSDPSQRAALRQQQLSAGLRSPSAAAKTLLSPGVNAMMTPLPLWRSPAGGSISSALMDSSLQLSAFASPPPYLQVPMMNKSPTPKRVHKSKGRPLSSPPSASILTTATATPPPTSSVDEDTNAANLLVFLHNSPSPSFARSGASSPQFPIDRKPSGSLVDESDQLYQDGSPTRTEFGSPMRGSSTKSPQRHRRSHRASEKRQAMMVSAEKRRRTSNDTQGMQHYYPVVRSPLSREVKVDDKRRRRGDEYKRKERHWEAQQLDESGTESDHGENTSQAPPARLFDDERTSTTALPTIISTGNSSSVLIPPAAMAETRSEQKLGSHVKSNARVGGRIQDDEENELRYRPQPQYSPVRRQRRDYSLSPMKMESSEDEERRARVRGRRSSESSMSGTDTDVEVAARLKAARKMMA